MSREKFWGNVKKVWFKKSRHMNKFDIDVSAHYWQHCVSSRRQLWFGKVMWNTRSNLNRVEALFCKLFQTVVECIFCGAKIQWFTAILSNWSLVFRLASPPLYWLPNKIQLQHYTPGAWILETTWIITFQLFIHNNDKLCPGVNYV